ncbi:MAG: hypothetical protein FD160_786 [Caulobacteraceae bacterium]|nr:MAG: hypothetical protein FD160_786 [Caulobacteraceae bacterium]
MLAVLVVVGLAVWGLLRAVFGHARPGRSDAGDVSRAPHADASSILLTISRGAGVRRSFSHAPRAPGPLCERALVSNPRRARVFKGLRAFSPAPRPPMERLKSRLRVHSVMRSIVLRA